jgi:hypothetical protein
MSTHALPDTPRHTLPRFYSLQVMRLPDSELSGVPTCLYGGASGAVGLVASLPRDLFEMLAALQNGLKKVRGRG